MGTYFSGSPRGSSPATLYPSHVYTMLQYVQDGLHKYTNFKVSLDPS